MEKRTIRKETIEDRVKPDSIEKTIDGIDTRDYPDFADAYVIVEYAEFHDGTPLNSEELEELGEVLTEDIDFDEIIQTAI